MKKIFAFSVFILLCTVLTAQETIVHIAFAKNSDSVIINGRKYGIGDNIYLELPLVSPLVCKTDTEANPSFKLSILFRGETVASADQDQYRSNGNQLKYSGLDAEKKYTVMLTRGSKVAKVLIANRTTPPPSVNSLQSGGNRLQPAAADASKTEMMRMPVLPGIAFYDALVLADPESLTKEELRNYFRYYFNAPLFSSENIIGQINDSVKNPYLFHALDKALITSILRKPDATDIGSQSLASAVKSLSLSSIGGLDITNIADGFAKFIVKRAKTELNAAFFDRFRELISRQEYADLRTLFPQTYRSLMAIGDEIYNYEAYIQTLRECFERDLANLLTSMPEVLQNHPEFFRNQPELKAILESAFYIGQELQDKQYPGDIIAGYPDEIWKDCNPNYRSSFLTLKMLSASLRSNDPESQGYWVTPDEMKILAVNRQALNIYIGLLIETSRNMNIVFISHSKPIALSDLMISSYSAIGVDLPQYERFISTFIGKSGEVASKMKGLKKRGSDSLLLENYYRFFSSVIDLLKFSSEIEDLPHFPRLGLKEKTNQYMDAAQTTADIVIDVNRRNYSSAVVNLYSLYGMIFSKENLEQPLAAMKTEQDREQTKYSADVAKLDDLKIRLSKAKSTSEKVQLRQDIAALEDTLQPWFSLTSEYRRLEKMTSVLNAIYKYGSFMASVVAAKTSDEVAEAIEAAALPAGSSRIKKETKFNVSLNSYLGLYVGYEQIRGFDTSGFRFNSFGVSAPIGVAISKGHSLFFVPTGRAGWSTSAFVSFIDIGALASFRVKDDSTSQIPTIHLQDIISPGVFLSIGFPKFPVSFNFGVQMGPNLRTVTATGNDYSNSLYLRYSASLVVDIPIFNFYSKSRD